MQIPQLNAFCLGEERDKKSFEVMKSGMLILQPVETLRDTQCVFFFFFLYLLHSLMAHSLKINLHD